MENATASPSPVSLPDGARLRSGTAARLAGLPVTTLRVWEKRYNVVAAPKTPNGQRLYGEADVERLRLLRALTQQGFAIGTIAGASVETLRALAGQSQRAAAEFEGGGGTHVVVVGERAVRKLAVLGPHRRWAVHADLDAAATAAAGEPLPVPMDLLLVHVTSLLPDVPHRVLELAAHYRAAAIVVLYAFGTEGVIASLRAAGAVVCRDSIAPAELARTLGHAGGGSAPLAESVPASPGAVRYDAEALAQIAELPQRIACECLRHVAELTMQLGSFERYSADCQARNAQDAELHRSLSRTAGAARALFEDALEALLADQAPEWVRPG